MTRLSASGILASVGVVGSLAAIALPSPGTGQAGPIGPTETRAFEVRPRPFDPPRGAPSVVARATAGFDASRPLDVVVFLHGWHGCAHAIVGSGPTRCRRGEPTVEGLSVADAVETSSRGSLLLVPQLAWRSRDGSPGRFRDEGLAARWLDATLDALGLRGRRIGRLTLAAHSAGFKSAIAILDRGAWPDVPTDVVLLDALYARTYDFARWATRTVGRRLVVVHTDSTAPETRRLRRWSRAHLRENEWLEEAARHRAAPWTGRTLVVRRTNAAHARVPAEELADVLRRLR